MGMALEWFKLATSRVRELARAGTLSPNTISTLQHSGHLPTPQRVAAGLNTGTTAIMRDKGYKAVTPDGQVHDKIPEGHTAIAADPSVRQVHAQPDTAVQQHISSALSNGTYKPSNVPGMFPTINRHEIDELRAADKAPGQFNFVGSHYNRSVLDREGANAVLADPQTKRNFTHLRHVTANGTPGLMGLFTAKAPDAHVIHAQGEPPLAGLYNKSKISPYLHRQQDAYMQESHKPVIAFHHPESPGDVEHQFNPDFIHRVTARKKTPFSNQSVQNFANTLHTDPTNHQQLSEMYHKLRLDYPRNHADPSFTYLGATAGLRQYGSADARATHHVRVLPQTPFMHDIGSVAYVPGHDQGVLGHRTPYPQHQTPYSTAPGYFLDVHHNGAEHITPMQHNSIAPPTHG